MIGKCAPGGPTGPHVMTGSCLRRWRMNTSWSDRATKRKSHFPGRNGLKCFAWPPHAYSGSPSEKISVKGPSIAYMHPIFTERAVDAQQYHRSINGARRTYYCGAHWRYGFHEDGVVSAINALQHFQDDLPGYGLNADEKQYLHRTG